MKRLLPIFLLLLTLPGLSQTRKETVDSLVSLLSAQSMELIEKGGVDYRKVTGPARFLHNNTYLLCDTALWNTGSQLILAYGNVRILQEGTVLSGDSLRYLIDADLAQFRGHLVQLEDKDHNMLRTRHLDYNTRDSVAVFRGGGAMRDADGQIIESTNGTYDSKAKLFTFTDNVNMFTDSIFVKTTRLEYRTDAGTATFGRQTDAWKDDNMLSADAGWYDRGRELFLFRQNVHMMSPDKEGWADSLYFYRGSGDIRLLGNVQLTDTTRGVTALAGRVDYRDSSMRVELTRDPAIIGAVGGGEQPADTVYARADRFVYRMEYKGDISEGRAAVSARRLEDLGQDAITTYRRKAAEEARKAAEEAARNDPNRPPDRRQGAEASPGDEDEGDEPPAGMEPPSDEEEDSDNGSAQPADSLSAALQDALASAADSLSHGLPGSLSAPSDTLSGAAADSLAVPVAVDSTKIGFLTATGDFRLFKQDIQMACDSLEYCDLDSLVRLYKRPLIWNEGNRQYTADSVYAAIRGQALEKVSLMSDAFVVIQEDSLCFDQIKATEMLAYFAGDGSLERFDALGDASVIFYIKEDSTFATVNKGAAKMLYATFSDGDIENVYYFQDAKSDAYPLAQMTRDQRELKGFQWSPSLRPSGKRSITTRTPRETRRKLYAARPRATYRQTEIYFPGYMKGIYEELDKREKEKEARRLVPPPADSLVPTPLDSIGAELPPTDSLALPADSLSRPVSPADTSGAAAPADTLSSSFAALTVPDPKAEKKAAKEAEKARKLEAKEARWAELDARDAAKAAAKAEKKAARKRRKTIKALERQRLQDEKDARRLEEYIRKYEARKQERHEKDS